VGGPGCDRTRTRDDAVTAVAAILAATANPQNPNEVNVSRPSDALAAKQATDTTLTALLLGLGAVALLVGGVGVAYTMVISVLERRLGIGLRRGDLDQAEQLLRARADAGDGAADLLADLLTKQGRGEEAERLRRFGLNPDGSIACA